jgi:hypothetical protein
MEGWICKVGALTSGMRYFQLNNKYLNYWERKDHFDAGAHPAGSFDLAQVRACVRACMRACMCACVRVCGCIVGERSWLRCGGRRIRCSGNMQCTAKQPACLTPPPIQVKYFFIEEEPHDLVFRFQDGGWAGWLLGSIQRRRASLRL